MSKPPNLRPADCCNNCIHWDYFGSEQWGCKKHNYTGSFSVNRIGITRLWFDASDSDICDDWEAEGESDGQAND